LTLPGQDSGSIKEAHYAIAAPRLIGPDSDLPVAAIPKLLQGPTIGAEIGKDEWPSASSPGLLRAISDGLLLSAQALLLVGYDDANLYAARVCPSRAADRECRWPITMGRPGRMMECNCLWVQPAA